jgi:hypothetical protein
MPEATIRFPAQMDLGHILRFGRELDDYAMHDRLVIDFGERAFFSPFAMLFLAAKLKFLRDRRPELRLDFRNYRGHTYAAHVGFFQMFGLDHGRDIGEAGGSENYLPITCVDRTSFIEDPSDEYKELPDLIQRYADRIALIIARDRVRNEDLFDVLSYSIREVMRNVFEHAQANSLYCCAQYWPRSNKVEFAISDFGSASDEVSVRTPIFGSRPIRRPSNTACCPACLGRPICHGVPTYGTTPAMVFT